MKFLRVLMLNGDIKYLERVKVAGEEVWKLGGCCYISLDRIEAFEPIKYREIDA